MKNFVEVNAKALVLLVAIVLFGILDAIGITGLNAEHYIGLIIADLLVWAVPNKDTA